jgi:hypothetical protein
VTPWRRLQKPWISVALLLLLIADAWAVGEHSDLLFRIGLSRPARQSGLMPDPTEYFCRTPRGLEACPDTSDPLAPDIEASVYLDEPVTGFWAPTTRHFDSRLHDRVRRGPPLTPDERRWLRDRFMAAWFADGSPDRERGARFLALPENPDCRSTIAAGYVHNGLAVALLAGLVCSLGWVPRLITARRHAALRADGLCPFCRYEVKGLKSAVCPECGNAVT